MSLFENQFFPHSSFPFYGSLPLNYDLLPSFGQKRRSGLEAVRNAIGHSLRVRKSQQSMRDNSFSHALRVRRGRQWDAMGHTLRFGGLKFRGLKFLGLKFVGLKFVGLKFVGLKFG